MTFVIVGLDQIIQVISDSLIKLTLFLDLSQARIQPACHAEPSIKLNPW
jgi:hypothetical protein